MKIFFSMCCLVIFLMMVVFSVVHADDNKASPSLETCLKKADELPDIAAANAEIWVKNGGGFQAKLCFALAQFKRNEFLDAAQKFSSLALLSRLKNPVMAASLYSQSGLSYMRAMESAEAETAYAEALKLNPGDPEIWVDRATLRTAMEHYWDALNDLNQALKLNPKEAVALRLRGQTWVKLGNRQKAQEDFLAAEDLDPQTLGVSHE